MITLLVSLLYPYGVSKSSRIFVTESWTVWKWVEEVSTDLFSAANLSSFRYYYVLFQKSDPETQQWSSLFVIDVYHAILHIFNTMSLTINPKGLK